MFAVEALGSYISRGVNTVSSPFHPFGGAVDIVVVEQQDGSFKSSPWYIRFGKFQGVLKAKEKVVNISVDGVEPNFHMYLDSAGVAYFLREVDREEMSSMLWPSSSGLQKDSDRMSLKSKSCNYDAIQSNSHAQTNVSSGKVVARTRSDGSQILGIVFESQSMKEVKFSPLDGKDDATSVLDGEEKKDLLIKDKVVINLENLGSQGDSGVHECQIGNSSESSFEKPEGSVEGTSAEMLCSSRETSPLSGRGVKGNNELNSEISRKINENGPDRLFDASETSRIGLDGFSEQAKETSEVSSQPETGILLAKEPLNVQRVLGDENFCNSSCGSKILESENLSSSTKSIVTETYSEMVTVHPGIGSTKEDESRSVCTISRTNSICVGQDELKTREEKSDSQEVPSDFSLVEEIEISQPESPEEEQFLFSDLDDFRPREVKCFESNSLDQTEKENHISLLSEGVESANESFCSNIESGSSPDKFEQENMQNDSEELGQDQKSISSHINIPKNSKVAAQEVGCLTESLPSVLSDFDDLDAQDIHSLLSQSLDSNSKPSKWLLIRKDVARYVKSARDEEHRSSKSKPTTEDAKISEELENVFAGAAVGDPVKISTASTGSWRLWPFSLSRSKKVAEPAPEKVPEPAPEKVAEPAPEKVAELDPKKVAELGTSCMEINVDNASESTSGMDAEKEVPAEKVRKHTIRANTPTSEQLESLNLKEGRNTVTFTFLTSMLGEQQVDASIYLWRWDARIVISDVDGTITKSDILGQFMPLVGKDWSHTGVAHLFAAIRENGYQMLFLSARSISQAYLTRQFLFNLKQDGVALPDGPVVISPDGLFPSLFREVIRRAPHEFKIACLEDIKALFPSDRNPFYAGFGNRDTDEISYLKVGIPKGKIFIVNPKGEVVVNRSVDTKSYTSLKALVSRMFPPPSSFEQEDFNSWNFWKLPPPSIDV